MKRVPSDTSVFHYYNANPKNINTCDCVIRAISTALDMEWINVYKELSEKAMNMYRMYDDLVVYSKYLKDKGYIQMKCPKKFNSNQKYNGVEFCKLIQNYDISFPILANIGTHHIVCIKDGKVHDTWNSSEDKIGIVWVHQWDEEEYNKIWF